MLMPGSTLVAILSGAAVSRKPANSMASNVSNLCMRIWWLLHAPCSRLPGCTPARCGTIRMRAMMIAARLPVAR